jgi:two-component system nitrogen regulation response regulator GlnG
MADRATPIDEETLLPCETVDVLAAAPTKGVAREPCVTILYHPDLRRLGERALAARQGSARIFDLSRTTDFAQPSGEPRPLGDPFVSRRPVEIRATKRSITIRPAPKSVVVVNGELLSGELTLPATAAEAGIRLELSKRVDLLLHMVGTGASAPSYGLVGESAGIEDVRRAVMRVADLDVPVLIRGETGVGKEKVAQAIHSASGARGPCVAVNMATVTPQMAASELFGHAKGAFTGAQARHEGMFARADGGTLFMDEVGELPGEVQAMLLRTLETGSILPLGEERERKISVRLVAATDAELDDAVRAGSFRAALYHRLSSYVIWVPKLRERREDIPRLVLYFLREELARVDEVDRLRPSDPHRQPWFPRSLMAAMVDYRWPGNVRELWNVVRQLVISNRGAEMLTLDPQLQRMFLEGDGDEPSQGQAPRSEIGEEALIEALKIHSWSFGPTARALGLSRTAFYRLVDKLPSIRKSNDLSREEIQHCFNTCGGDLKAMSERLCVSARGIQLRMTELGLPK